MKIGRFFSIFSSRLRMKPKSRYLVSCLVLVSFLFDAAEPCWDTKIAPDYGEMTKDYDLQVGSDLVLNCTLRRTDMFTENYHRYISSSDLVFEKDSEDFSKFTKRIDNVTLQLRIPKAREDNSGIYLCKIFINNHTKPVVCGSQVSVGYPPQNVSNFTCINRNYETLTCTWNIEKNPVKTKYSVVKYLMMNALPQVCPNVTANSCEWSRNNSGFLTFGRSIFFTVTGKNSLGSISNDFILSSSAIVIFNQPENLKIANISSRSITVTWDRPSLVTGDEVNLRFQILLSSDSSPSVEYDAGNNTSKFTVYNLIPYISYNVSIRCRSLGTEREDMWSPFASIVATTPSDVPYKVPETIPEAYELHYYQESRSVSLYWKIVPEMHHNGENFHYLIKVLQEMPNGTSDIFAMNSSSPYLTVKNLQRNVPYIFHLHSANKNGLSENHSTIFVDSENGILPAPRDVRVIFLDFGVYNLSWNPPNDQDTFTYRIFWCPNLMPWGNHCESSINWFNETLLDTNKILNLYDLKTNFHFAVVSQIESKSSGMQWASCIVAQKGGIGKIKYVLVVQKNSTSLKVIWKLDCPAQKGVMKKYEITYCKLGKCNVVEVKPDLEEFLLQKLHPFSNYSVRIQAVNLENNRSEISDPVYQMTLPGAPSGPPQNIKVHSNSSTSFVISWMPPAEPNGIITKYIIRYNGSTALHNVTSDMNEYSHKVDGLKPYTVYAVQVEACVNSDCSKKSDPVMIQTDIDVPGYMEPPRIEEVNSTHLKLSWSAPVSPNGPVDFYIIKWLDENQNDTSNPNILTVPNVNSVILDVRCPSENEEAIKYNFYIRSVNVKNTTNLFGPFSKSIQARACQVTAGKAMFVGLVAGICLGVVVVLLMAVKFLRWMYLKVNQVKGMKIRLPEGLEGPETNPLNNYEFFKNGLNGNIAENNNGRLSYVIDENKNRHGSGSSQFSNSSTEELIFKNGKCLKFGRKPSGDSSGCSSMSSNATPRVQLSSDSGTESDFTVPPSPDSAIADQSSHNSHKSPLPILMEVYDPTSLEKQPSQQEFSPDKQFNNHKITSDDMILKVDPPYSKFGLAGNSTASVNPLVFYSGNLANSEPSVFDAQKPEKVDTTMVPYSKVGLAKSSSDLLGRSSLKQMGYSKFGFPSSQKRFSIPPANLNPIAMLMLENTDKSEWPGIKKTLNKENFHSKEVLLNIPSKDFAEDSNYIKVGRGNLCPIKPSQGYVPFNDLKNQMDHSPLHALAKPADLVETLKTDKIPVESPSSVDLPAVHPCEEIKDKDNPAKLLDVPFILISPSGGTVEEETDYFNNSSIPSCSLSSSELRTKVPSESDHKCSSDSLPRVVTNLNNSLLTNEASILPNETILLCPKDNVLPEEPNLNGISDKTNNYALSNELIVNPVTLRNGYVPFHSLTNSPCDRTPNPLPKVPETNVSKTVFPNGICAGADNYLTSTQMGNARLLRDDSLPKTISVVPSPGKKDCEKPVQNGNGYSSLSLKYILKPLPKMESEICEV